MKTTEIIYDILSQHSSGISGEAIAKQLNISRTSVWKAIKSLESQGLVIESSKQNGYRLLEGDLLIPEIIEKALQIQVSYNEKSISTQKDAKENIMTNPKTPQLYLAPKQEMAKGRMNRPFFTSENGGIYMSLHLKPNVHYSDLEPFTMMAASSITKAISRLTGIDTQIKWVNDIYLGQKKIAGIITEAITSVETGLITDVIIGIGLNFFIKDFPDDLNSKAGSLFSVQPTVTRNQLIIEIWKLFTEIPVKDHIKVYKDKSLVLNRQVTFMENDTLISGKAIAITDEGHLVIRLESGQEKILRSGEISLSSW
ncbi:bifunctional biotin--[acetyl-CoA-carboxylase] ligase/biotin operon repressor BirA [Streptococcus uberis]|uniref:bifunctional biotin--[acetyl-CoA-carboxylase] ligase/biotin operon repressor BirA n=1 Tax=Streptococcus uberis TaxID=1349 RepID=UPI0021F1CB90|nr:bifunctional biotin--[acetyl-CoA-carboxylase] ligase/biotin operon repressor BirA [Streptococcus uberis]MCK1236339.1 bifunctional biotin--[acetyl-CoA-carboxylase] ligase/biotin operon repressor BirA [Streptococcus uberis]MCK1256466.1 bifunctional biotin--[acetyl-CoA-carboxylase] ligase/biotin operon repressor BirA [Streptococcus uberis]MCV6815022.1 bifunctional biotin--[acetyl-CoA-carboxylase] ligase/biotin operon repressor BirA [Streptococcus uberis]MCZ8476018.1 bifunctional biotin--[acetyl